ncbi:putative methyltransferase, partial [Microbispora rosea]
TRLATLLAKPYAADPERVAIAVPAGLEAALPRLLLATRARHVRVLTAGPVVDLPALAALLAPVYRLAAAPPEAGHVLDAVRLSPPDGGLDRVVRRIMDSAHGKAGNAWREALTETAGLTKRQARAAVEETAPWAVDATPLELPLHRLARMTAQIAAT